MTPIGASQFIKQLRFNSCFSSLRLVYFYDQFDGVLRYRYHSSYRNTDEESVCFSFTKSSESSFRRYRPPIAISLNPCISIIPIVARWFVFNRCSLSSFSDFFPLVIFDTITTQSTGSSKAIVPRQFYFLKIGIWIGNINRSNRQLPIRRYRSAYIPAFLEIIINHVDNTDRSALIYFQPIFIISIVRFFFLPIHDTITTLSIGSSESIALWSGFDFFSWKSVSESVSLKDRRSPAIDTDCPVSLLFDNTDQSAQIYF